MKTTKSLFLNYSVRFFRIIKFLALILITSHFLIGCENNSSGNKKLSQDLRSQDNYLRAEAAKQLLRKGTEGYNVLIEALKDPNPDVRQTSAVHLASLGSKAKEIVPIIKEWLNDKDYGVKTLTLFCLGAIGPSSEEALPLIGPLLNDPNINEMASEAIMNIVDVNDSNMVKPLCVSLRSSNPRVRVFSATALGRISCNSEIAVPVLIEALNDEINDVKIAACYALGWYGKSSHRALQQLQILSNTNDVKLKKAALWAIDKINNQLP